MSSSGWYALTSQLEGPGKSRLTDPLVGFRGLFEGISATWFRAMSYSLVRFWAFDFAKEKLVEREAASAMPRNCASL